MSAVIEVKNVSRSFKSVKKEEGMKGAWGLLVKPQIQVHDAVKNVSFALEPGSFTGLIGANGAGKTTLLKMLAGLIPPSSGEARVLGYEPFKRTHDFRRKIALVMGQKAQLWWDLPAIDAFDLIRAIYEIPTATYKERLNELSNLLDVSKHLNTQIRRLSLGERMKMELIGAILHWPSVIFLDEPTIGLDVLAAHKLREFLRVFNQREKATIILTSHNMDDIERLCSRVLIMRSGQLIYDGKPAGLVQASARQLRVRLVQSPSAEDLASATQLPVTAIEIEEGGEEAEGSKVIRFNVKQEQIVALLQSLMGKFQIVDMGIEGQSLEKVIQNLYEEDRAVQ
jgi:ABC-2 type transport system ATP-binding protein